MQKRCFLAIDVNDHVKMNVKVVQDHVKESEADVKIVEAENLHFTVKFLGNLAEDQIERIIATLKPLLHDELPSKVSVQGLGFFGPADQPRVIWAGVGDGKPYIEGLFARILSAIRDISPENEEKEVIPHITIARVRSNKNIYKLKEIISKESETFFGETEITEVKLKESVLTPEGPRYADIAVFPLRKV
ncbi:MAG: RNA 2',3'-cyclic phosphodiesterase [Candidatus Aenigmarchaeota archaeon]|nr:RNA 2',3'-cyclic phosphodiesterase [Candidatus Aenigmarchaeota archaeon]